MTRDDPQLDLTLSGAADAAPGTGGATAPDGASDEGAVFLTPALEELLEELSHAAQFSGGIQVVEGSRGSGKSCLASLLPDELSHCPHVGFVCASPGGDPHALLLQLLLQLGLPVAKSQAVGELIAALRHFGQSLHGESQVAVLIIDDAHHLDQQMLAALASVLQTGTDEGFGVHLVLWAEPGLVERLDALQLVDIPIHDYEMPALTPEAFAAFAEWMLGRKVRLSTTVFQRMWVESGGCIGEARRLLEAHRNEAAASSAGWEVNVLLNRARSLPLGHFAALLLLAGVLLWAVLSREPVREPVEQPIAIAPEPIGDAAPKAPATPRDETLSVQPEPTVSTSNAGDEKPEDAESAPVEAETMARENPATETLRNMSLEPVVDERELRNALYANQSVADTDEPVPEEGDALDGGESGNEASVAPTPVPPTPSAGVKKGAQALMGLSPNAYSLQVMSAGSRESLERFRAGQSNRDRLYLYETRRSGKPWFVLLAGHYPSREAALTARENLPQAQRSTGPWPRKLEDVHAEITAIGGF